MAVEPNMVVRQRNLTGFASEQLDPTRTTVLRAQLVSTINRRWNAVMQQARREIQEGRAYDIGTFMAWLRRTIEREVFEDNGAAWIEPYLRQAFIRGMRHADRSLGLDPEQIPGVPPIELDGQFNFAPAVATIAVAAAVQLRGAADETLVQVRRALAAVSIGGGGLGPMVEAVLDRIAKIGRTRSRVWARTKIIGTFAEASLIRYEYFGIDQVNGQAEFRTAGNYCSGGAEGPCVCEECEGLEGRIFSLAEARGVIPVHPQCHCAWLPVIPARLLNFRMN